VTKSVEKFDLTKNCWKRIADMNMKRKGCAGVRMPDGIYVIGGFDGCQYLKSVEKFDFVTKKWSYIEDMNYPRCLFSSCVSSDLQYIYVAGGYDGKPLTVCER
jgi:influenza virus NS1A-binding protein